MNGSVDLAMIGTSSGRRWGGERLVSVLPADLILALSIQTTTLELLQGKGARETLWASQRRSGLLALLHHHAPYGLSLAPPISLDSRLAKTAGPERKGRDGPEAEGEQGDRRS